MLWKFMHKGVKLLPHWVKSFKVIDKAQYYVLQSNLITPNWSCNLLLETKQDKKMKYKKELRKCEPQKEANGRTNLDCHMVKKISVMSDRTGVGFNGNPTTSLRRRCIFFTLNVKLTWRTNGRNTRPFK